MKKTFLILIAFLIGITTFSQVLGDFPVSSNFGGGVEGANRQRVIDASGTYVRNIAPHEIDYLQSHGLWNSRFAIVSPSGYAATVIYSQVPTDGTADLTVARASVKTTVNQDLLLQEIAATVPSIDFTDGTPVILAEPQRTNELTRSVNFGHSDWTKSGANIIGDASTATGEEINNADDADFDTDTGNWLDNSGGVFNGVVGDWAGGAGTGIGKITLDVGGSANGARLENMTMNSGSIYFVTITVKLLTGSSVMIRVGSEIGITGNYFELTPTGTETVYTGQFAARDGFTERFYVGSFDSDGQVILIDNISVQEVTGFPAPHSDSPLNVSSFKLTEDNQTSTHYFTKSAITVTNGVTLTQSIKAKQGERNWIRFEEIESADGYYFDLDNGVVGTEIGTTVASSITALSDGWWDISITVTVPSTAAEFRVGLADADNSNSYAGDGSSGAFIAFTQLEEGAYPTSWIYSIAGGEGATTTRLADEINNAGVAGTFNSEAGYLYMESAALFDDLTDRYISISDGSVANAVQLYYSSTTNQIVGKIIVGSAAQATLTYTLSDETEFSKALFSWATNDFTLVVNGVERATDVSGSVPAAGTFDEFSLDDGAGTNEGYMKIKAVIHGDAISAAKRVSITTQ